MFQRLTSSLLLAVLLLLVVVLQQQETWTVYAEGPLGIPGTTQTLAGYDTELGTDPICWSSIASPTPDNGIPFPNGELVENFSMADKVELLPQCPDGTWLEVFAPVKFFKIGQGNDESDRDSEINSQSMTARASSTPGLTEEERDEILEKDVSQVGSSGSTFRPRTYEWYNYTVNVSIDLRSLNGSYVVSDDQKPFVAVSVVACDSVTAGFCSPFVHEQAYIREARIEASYTPEQAAAAALKPKRATGDRHGGTHVHAPAVLVDLDTVDVVDEKYEFSVEVPTIINQPGNFFVIGTLQLYLGEDIDGQPKFRYDIANALSLEEHVRFVTYQDPPVILEVSDAVRTVSYIFVGIACGIMMYVLFQTIRHYNSQVLQISQAPFLVVFQVSAIVATASSVLFDPRSDLWCNLAQPLVFIFLQIMYAVTFGRLWRIHAVVSPLLRNRLQRATSKKGVFDRVGFRRLFCQSNTVNIRREVTNSKVVIISAFWILPQVILQSLAAALQPLYKTVEFNDDQSIGRCVCDNDVERKKSIHLYSLCILFVLVLALLIMAHIARQLPSLLNESSVIYDSTVTSILLAILGAGVMSVTNDPTTSPDVEYLIYVILTLSVTLTFCVRIMMPKLRMVWNGQVVLVSKLVSDHRQSLQNSTRLNDKNSIMHGVTGFNPSDSATTRYQTSGSGGSGLNSSTNSAPNSSLIRQDTNGEMSERTNGDLSERNDTYDDSFVGRVGDLNKTIPTAKKNPKHSDAYSLSMEGESSDTSDPTSTSHDAGAIVDEKNQSQLPNNGKARVSFKEDEDEDDPEIRRQKKGKSAKKGKIIVREGETPSRKLTVKMFDLQTDLDHIMQQIMSGLAVDRSDWEAVRKATGQLDECWSLVEFDWQAAAADDDNANDV
mmetsp:Transcript_41862/g.100496  ORF Transcript_41862/g.100496 Transcript_41862/m.100496 type:complete len:889 (-) Transcript_41862:851-3517(-)